MLNRSAWPPGTSHRREVAKSGFSGLAPEIRGSYFASNAPSRLHPTHRTPVAGHFLSERSESGILQGAVLLKMPGAGPEKSCRAPERDGCRRPSPTLALVLASLVSIPIFLFSGREKPKKDGPGNAKAHVPDWQSPCRPGDHVDHGSFSLIEGDPTTSVVT